MSQSRRPFASLWPGNALHLASINWNTPEALRPAAHQALNTVELLEQILLHVRWNHLFVLQSISKTWRDVIQQSILLRDKMCLSSPDPPTRPVSDMYYYGDRMSRVVYHSSGLDVNPATRVSGMPSSEGLRIPLAEWNVRDLGSFLQLSVGLGGTVEEEEEPDLTPSWRKMFITNPPLLAINFDFLPDEPDAGYGLTVYNPRGVTFGELYDWTWRLSREYEKSTGKRPSGRLAVVLLWLMHPDGRMEMEEAW